jgi:hypothetical protein
MKRVLLTCLAVCIGVVAARAKLNPPCKAYVLVVEQDGITTGLAMAGLNKPQWNWYRKHGEKGKYMGICVLNPQPQETLEYFFSHFPSGADRTLPLYAIFWGERLVSEPYSGSYETQEEVQGNVSGTATDNEGNTSDVEGTTTTTVPVQHTYSGVKHFFVADGRLAIWDTSAKQGKGDFVPIRPIHNHNRTVFTSASTSLLKKGLEQIVEREGLQR